ncbi:MAG: type II toxin-antitoxin system HicA family toxin [Candidatus Margulisbacteria bacterium]|nr:type II toxin-antitoxin system HicA family toxin [Candidatus Margulisiibacteriota bacterium]
MRARRLVKLLEQNGFIFARQKGSHAIYKKVNHKRIIVPMHSKDIPIGTLQAILKDAGLKNQK